MNQNGNNQLYDQLKNYFPNQQPKLSNLISADEVHNIFKKKCTKSKFSILEQFDITKYFVFNDPSIQGNKTVKSFDLKSLLRDNDLNPNENYSEFIGMLKVSNYPLTRYTNGIKSEHFIATIGSYTNTCNIQRRKKAILIENSTNYCYSEHYIDKVKNIDDYDIIFTNGNAFSSIVCYEEVICFFDWDFAGLKYFFDLKKINPNCEFYVSDLYMKIASECFRTTGIDYTTYKDSYCYNRAIHCYTDNVRIVIEFLTCVKGIVEQEAFLAYDNKMQLIPIVNDRIEASLIGESHSAISEHVQISYMIDGVNKEKFVRKIELGDFLGDLIKKHGTPMIFNRLNNMLNKLKSGKSDSKFGIHVHSCGSAIYRRYISSFDYNVLLTSIKFNLKLSMGLFDIHILFKTGLDIEQEKTLMSLLPTIKNTEIKAIVISILAVNKNKKQEGNDKLKDKIIETVRDLKPSMKTIKIKDSKLRYITEMLVESDLVVRVADEKFYHLPLNYYREIYNAVRVLPEFKELVKNDLNNRIKDCVISWKTGKHIKYDTILKQSDVRKANFVLSRMTGTTKLKNIVVDGKRKQFVMIDSRLVQHLLNVFRDDAEFKARFLK